ncbi:MAG: DUF692 domain-containing protein [Verrucomicrobia bacterium]|nr:DUF692 domain-containing protein [Verrucomicrobiota bacterium]
MRLDSVEGVGIGFRRELAKELLNAVENAPRFVELAPENWMGIGGRWGKVLGEVVERYPILSHGLSLSLGSPEPLDWKFLRDLKVFLQQARVQIFSEHLSFCKCANAHLHDLLPLPFTEEAVAHVSGRIREAQKYLERRIAIENITYYTPIDVQMDEATFIRSVVEEADCDLLLDINNVYVNAHNHGYDPKQFISSLPLERVVYIHIAGHEEGELYPNNLKNWDLERVKAPEFDDLNQPNITNIEQVEIVEPRELSRSSKTNSSGYLGIKIDSHGEPVCQGVFDLFAWAIERIPPVPVLLERDNNIPPYSELVQEMQILQDIYDRGKLHAVC